MFQDRYFSTVYIHCVPYRYLSFAQNDIHTADKVLLLHISTDELRRWMMVLLYQFFCCMLIKSLTNAGIKVNDSGIEQDAEASG